MGATRVVPSAGVDGLLGFKVFGIRRGSILQRLGFQNGDLVRTVAGQPITAPDRALAPGGVLVRRRGQEARAEVDHDDPAVRAQRAHHLVDRLVS